MVPIQEFNAALTQLDHQSAGWYRARHGDICRMCVESTVSRHFLLTMLGYQMRMARTGEDFTLPLVLLAGTMLQTGYAIGRKHAEAEILEGWMRL